MVTPPPPPGPIHSDESSRLQMYHLRISRLLVIFAQTPWHASLNDATPWPENDAEDAFQDTEPAPREVTLIRRGCCPGARTSAAPRQRVRPH